MFRNRERIVPQQAELAMADVLECCGFDTTEGALTETPARVVRALLEMTRGYEEDPAAILSKVFELEGPAELIAVRRIPFTSLCEHHLLPFTGFASVGYLPREPQGGEPGLVVGLSKLARLVDCFARRLQLQERLTQQVATALDQHLRPWGVIVVVEAAHACMTCRGVNKPGASMITSALRGKFLEDASARAEALSIIRGG